MSGFILVIAEFPTAGNRRRWADTMAQAACASRDTNTTNFIAPSWSAETDAPRMRNDFEVVTFNAKFSGDKYAPCRNARS